MWALKIGSCLCESRAWKRALFTEHKPREPASVHVREKEECMFLCIIDLKTCKGISK